MAESFIRVGVNLRHEWPALFKKLETKLKCSQTELIQKALAALAEKEGVRIEYGSNS